MGDFERTVFPMLRHAKGRVTLIGTGFFIAPHGLLATAKPVFEVGDTSERDSFDIFQHCGNDFRQRLITRIHSHCEYDIAICELESAHNNFPTCRDHPVVSTMQTDPVVDGERPTFCNGSMQPFIDTQSLSQ